MTDLVLELDMTASNKRLSYRERLSIRILLVVFGLVYPARFNHKLEEFIKEFIELMDAE